MTITGTTGNDTLSATSGDNLILGLAGDDVLTAGTGHDTLNGGAGNDIYRIGQATALVQLDAGFGVDTIANDLGIGGHASAYAIELAAPYTSTSAHLSLVNNGDASGGTWVLSFDGQADRIEFQQYPYAFNQVTDSPGQVTAYVPVTLTFGDGVVWGADEFIARSLTAEQPGLVISGSSASDRLAAPTSSGPHVLLGGAGDDTLVGSIYSDLLQGGSGNDTYLFSGNWGTDRSAQVVTSTLPSGWYPDQAPGAPLYSVAAGAGPIRIDNGDTVRDGRLDVIRFEQGVSVSDLSFQILNSDLFIRRKEGAGEIQVVGYYASQGSTGAFIQDIQFADGTHLGLAEVLALNNDTLTGTDGNDTLDGGIGHDVLSGLGGNDVLYGGSGDDSLSGGAGDDSLSGDIGHDVLQGGVGNDVLSGYLGDDRYEGGAGNDRLSDLGQPVYKLPGVYGPGGSDTYVFMSGFGNDTIQDVGLALSDATDQDVIEFGEGILARDLMLTMGYAFNASGSLSLLISSRTSTDTLLIEGQMTSNGGHAVQSIERFRFADGTQWLWSDLYAMTATTLVGSDNPDALNAHTGRDTLVGFGGNDRLTMIDGDGGVLDGGTGNDTMTGASGADVFRFAAGDGQDLVHADSRDTLSLAATLSRASLQVGRLGATVPNAVVLSFMGSTDSITLDNAGAWNGLTLAFGADGSTMTGAEVLALASRPADLTLTGTSGKDILTGGDGFDTLSGLAGNDSLSGGKGNDLLDGGLGADTLAGGLGNDRLIGGKGNDTYLFARGEGQDVIVDQDGTWFNSDLLKVSGATSRQLWLSQSGNNLKISVIGTSDQVTIEGWYASSNNRIEKITASDGKTLSASKVSALVSAMAAFAPPAEGQTTLPADVQASLSKVLASSWV